MKTQTPQTKRAVANWLKAQDNLRAADKLASANCREADHATEQVAIMRRKYDHGKIDDYSDVQKAEMHARELRDISDASYEASNKALIEARKAKAAAAATAS